MAEPVPFFDGPPLVPGEATAALLVTPDGRYLLQHRDDKPEIFFPGWWGTFGGALDAGETPEHGILRELDEELSFCPARLRHFSTIGLDFCFAGRGMCPRHYFEIEIETAQIDRMVLAEGQGMALFSADQVMAGLKVVPYDLTAIWQHRSQSRF